MNDPRNLWPDWISSALTDLDARTRRRVLRAIDSAQGPHVRRDGRDLILACSNDYLGLAADPRLRAAMISAIERWGVGAGASRLISGTMRPHDDLEDFVADWHGVEAALTFTSGYHANVGILQALLGPGDIVYSDALNHATLIDGCRLSRAKIRVYPHADAAALERLLRTDVAHGGKRLIVTDAVFSMDADEAPLVDIVEIAERYDAWLMVDEAHAGGILGAEGRGLAHDLGVAGRVPILMGTFGKALGTFGAYVAGSRTLIDLLINRARSLIYTTALPPSIAAATIKAVEIVRSADDLRRRVHELSKTVRTGLQQAGWRVLPGRVPIIPVLVGDDRATMILAQQLVDRGVLAVGIRPPTVPEGTARIRLTLTAAHSDSDVSKIVAAFGPGETRA